VTGDTRRGGIGLAAADAADVISVGAVVPTAMIGYLWRGYPLATSIDSGVWSLAFFPSGSYDKILI
jgi:hypothetical protein